MGTEELNTHTRGCDEVVCVCVRMMVDKGEGTMKRMQQHVVLMMIMKVEVKGCCGSVYCVCVLMIRQCV